MDFGTRLAMLRKHSKMTQQTLADAVGCHVTMIRRYEANEAQPTLEVIRNMARALSVSSDSLVFEQGERGPSQELLLQFEAISLLLPQEQAVVRDVLESLIIKYQTRRWDAARLAAVEATEQPAKKKVVTAPRKKDAPTKRAPLTAHR